VLDQHRRPATPEDAEKLQIRPGDEVLQVLRVRGLDGEPVLLERNVYAAWAADAVERLPADCVSVVRALYDDVGMVFAYGEHVIDAVAAGAEDARLLGIRRGSPLLRIRRVTTTPAGRPIEWSDDRYVSGTVSFTVANSIGSNPLARQAGRV
jgi:GntR family transcriptional regulator